MPDSFDSQGLQIATKPELVTALNNAFKSIYGVDINIDSNSPDGQIIGILSQLGIDMRELLALINAGFDPDQAEGAVLDMRCSINGIMRLVGTFSQVSVAITTSGSCTLVGLDSQAGIVNPSVPNLYTIKDASGNLWYLLATTVISGAGVTNCLFQSAVLGNVVAPANTLTIPVTIVSGVTSINNSASNTLVGQNEESDAALKIRRRQSTAISAIGALDGLEAALKSLPGVSAVFVYENMTSTTDANGVPGHSVWIIVQGGSNADIAQTIYAKRSEGCGMKGAVTYSIPRSNNRFFVAAWDIPSPVNLYIKFNLELIGGVIDHDSIKALIVKNIVWDVGQDAVGDVVTAYVRSLNTNYRITGMLLSDDNITFTEIVTRPTPASQFVNDASRISIT